METGGVETTLATSSRHRSAWADVGEIAEERRKKEERRTISTATVPLLCGNVLACSLRDALDESCTQEIGLDP